MTSVAIWIQSIMADYGHVTCDEISLILELGSNLIYYFGTNDGLSFMAHGSPRMYLWSLTLTQLITEVYHLTTSYQHLQTRKSNYESGISRFMFLGFFWIYVKGWDLKMSDNKCLLRILKEMNLQFHTKA